MGFREQRTGDRVLNSECGMRNVEKKSIGQITDDRG